jgi:hypothetical protein
MKTDTVRLVRDPPHCGCTLAPIDAAGISPSQTPGLPPRWEQDGGQLQFLGRWTSRRR